MDNYLDKEGAKKIFNIIVRFVSRALGRKADWWKTVYDVYFSSGKLAMLRNSSSTGTTSSTIVGSHELLTQGSMRCNSNFSGSNYTNGTYKAKSTLYNKLICFLYSVNELVPVAGSSSTSTSKTLTTLDFDPFGVILYYEYSSTVTANLLIYANRLYEYYHVNLRYTFNVSSLDSNKDVFVKCVPQSNGRVKLATTDPLTQVLPTTEDGFVYILLGHSINGASEVLLTFNHPIYYYKDGALRLWTNAEDISGKEDNTNKVTSISSSSTDTQYPSAKCVYDLSNLKLNKIPIVSVASNTSSLSCEEDKYYRLDTAVNTFSITLPTVTDVGIAKSVIIYLTTGTTPAVTITSTQQLHYSYGFSLEASKTYEINALWNGAAWAVTNVEIITS